LTFAGTGGIYYLEITQLCIKLMSCAKDLFFNAIFFGNFEQGLENCDCLWVPSQI
jgi:hypothetical protein